MKMKKVIMMNILIKKNNKKNNEKNIDNNDMTDDNENMERITKYSNKNINASNY